MMVAIGTRLEKIQKSLIAMKKAKLKNNHFCTTHRVQRVIHTKFYVFDYGNHSLKISPHLCKWFNHILTKCKIPNKLDSLSTIIESFPSHQKQRNVDKHCFISLWASFRNVMSSPREHLPQNKIFSILRMAIFEHRGKSTQPIEENNLILIDFKFNRLNI